MARKTKEEALETRNRILETAEYIFSEKGVAYTSLQDIAAAADVTRGAIYWHFKNKTDLLEAMLQRVKMPMEDVLECNRNMDSPDPLGQLRASTIQALHLIADNPSARRVCEILTFKCEYVDETAELRRRHIESRSLTLQRYETGFRNAVALKQLPSGMDPGIAAIGLHALVYGLFMDFLLTPEQFDIKHIGPLMIDNFLAGLSVQSEPQLPSK